MGEVSFRMYISPNSYSSSSNPRSNSQSAGRATYYPSQSIRSHKNCPLDAFSAIASGLCISLRVATDPAAQTARAIPNLARSCAKKRATKLQPGRVTKYLFSYACERHQIESMHCVVALASFSTTDGTKEASLFSRSCLTWSALSGVKVPPPIFSALSKRHSSGRPLCFCCLGGEKRFMRWTSLTAVGFAVGVGDRGQSTCTSDSDIAHNLSLINIDT